MRRHVSSFLSGLVPALAAAALLLAPFAVQSALALDDPPTPKVDCTKKANKKNPKCQKSNAAGLTGAEALNDDELYNAAYWLSRQGDYSASLALLKQIKNADEPRVLNAMGFATRKLGNVESAMPYYIRALTLDPNFTRAREYLGEAHLTKGDVAAAKVQLLEIATRCGISCSGYPELAEQISVFEAGASQPAVKIGG